MKKIVLLCASTLVCSITMAKTEKLIMLSEADGSQEYIEFSTHKGDRSYYTFETDLEILFPLQTAKKGDCFFITTDKNHWIKKVSKCKK